MSLRKQGKEMLVSQGIGSLLQSFGFAPGLRRTPRKNAYAKIIAGMTTSHARTYTKLRRKVRISTFSPITVIRISRIIVTKKDTGPISFREVFSFYVETLDRQYEYLSWRRKLFRHRTILMNFGSNAKRPLTHSSNTNQFINSCS